MSALESMPCGGYSLASRLPHLFTPRQRTACIRESTKLFTDQLYVVDAGRAFFC
jgi:hypothetical protein